MQIKLENVGIIKNSLIDIKGLTVITGKNNSGKTTVGKVIYSLIDAVCNLDKKAERDKRDYIIKQLREIERIFEFFRGLRHFFDSNNTNIFEEYPHFKRLVFSDYSSKKYDELKQYTNKLYLELKIIDFSQLFRQLKKTNRNIFDFIVPSDGRTNFDFFIRIMNKKQEEAFKILDDLFIFLDSDPRLIDYTRESINRTLRNEFSNQIQPVKNPSCLSRIEIEQDGDLLFSFSIKENNIIKEGKPVFYNSPFNNVFLVDNPFVLDNLSSRSFFPKFYSDDTSFFFNSILNHEDKLKRFLLKRNDITIFEQVILDKQLKSIKKQLDKILPGTYDFSDDNYYVQDGKKLKINNLATGSKLFSIIKILLEKGFLNETTMFIFDEPEAHLHPEWQNVFAEIIVLLVKELGVTVLLTTHSSNFMLALDANMRKYEINDKTNFYQTEKVDNDFLTYVNVNDDIGKIYQDFLLYLSEAKMLRDKYVKGLK
jgi:predicted ATPase